MEQKGTKQVELPLLKKYAFLGTPDQFSKKLKQLADLAEKENWTTNSSKHDYDILFQYIIHTFERIHDERKILVSPDEQCCCFNTGLMTDMGEDIIGFFVKNKNVNKKEEWYLENFYHSSDRKIVLNFSECPKVAEYFEKPELMYFNPNYNIIVSTNHILSDNKSRFPSEILERGDKHLNMLFNGSLELTKKKIKRNYRLVVPQYYKKAITYLLPIELDEYRCALAVELLENEQYRANTIFTLDMAYSNARLLMKPEADWLSIKKDL